MSRKTNVCSRENTKTRQERESRLQKQGDTRNTKQKDRELDISQQTLDASRESRTSRKKKKQEAKQKNDADQRSTAARENEVKRIKNLRVLKLMQRKNKNLHLEMYLRRKSVTPSQLETGVRSKKDDTGGQAVRSIDTASDAVGGLARGIVGGLAKSSFSKRQDC